MLTLCMLQPTEKLRATSSLQRTATASILDAIRDSAGRRGQVRVLHTG